LPQWRFCGTHSVRRAPNSFGDGFALFYSDSVCEDRPNLLIESPIVAAF
jgi:hypothetical protein